MNEHLYNVRGPAQPLWIRLDYVVEFFGPYPPTVSRETRACYDAPGLTQAEEIEGKHFFFVGNHTGMIAMLDGAKIYFTARNDHGKVLDDGGAQCFCAIWAKYVEDHPVSVAALAKKLREVFSTLGDEDG